MMWPFKKKKPEKYPILVLHGIGQKLTFVYRPDRVLYVHDISTLNDYDGRFSIRLEAHEL